MIKVSITYTGSKPLSIITNDFNTISEFRQKWLSDPANNMMVRVPEGGTLISKRNVETLAIEQLDENSNVLEKAIYSGSDLALTYAAGIDLAMEIKEKTEESIMAEAAENIEFEVEVEEAVEPEIIETSEEVMVEEIQVVEEKEEESTPIPQKSQNFREKFLDRESRADAWENNIIEKMDRRIANLESFAKVLDGENDYLEQFKQEKLG